MPPDYLLKHPLNPEGTQAENYAVYASGLCRRVGGEELTYLRDKLEVPQVTLKNEDQVDRVKQVDSAVRGQ